MGKLGVRVQPGASRSEVVGWEADGSLRVRLQAPPIEGRANRALIECLAEALGLRRSAITLVRGSSSRQKVVEVEGLALAAIRQRLEDSGYGGA